MENKKSLDLPKNKKIIAAVIMALMATAGYVWLKKDTKHEEPKPQEEVYAVQREEPQATKVTQAVLADHQDTRNAQVEPPSQEVIAARLALIQEKQQELQQRLAAPLMPVNNTSEPASDTKPEGLKSSNANTQFWLDASRKEIQVENAIHMGSLSTLVAEGSFIHAILEPATNSDLPGSLRAIVSEPTYAEDGSRILIPRGSRLIGEYKSGIQQGQSRIFIVWNRLITPEGYSLKLGSQGVDSLGRAGQGADSVDNHFWERFGSASLLSLIGAGTANLGVSNNDQGNSASSYRSALANSFSQSASQSLAYDSGIATTLETWQGKPIMVFVAKDLHFDDVLKTKASSIQIF
jgi:type IV secretory pathway VirB10-like protein